MWAGAISFGLVNIPVKLYAATGQRDVAFRQVHREDGGRIRFHRVGTVCGREVRYADVAKPRRCGPAWMRPGRGAARLSAPARKGAIALLWGY
jgi:DNA end-binding protein Ku